jgi:pimeloyl-ACP methyl ester carboxylesterase
MGGAARRGGRAMTAAVERASSATLGRLAIGPIELEVLHQNAKAAGAPTLVLVHGINNISPRAPFLDLLAEIGEIIAPSHPGFGNSPGPGDFDTMYDLVHVYLSVLDAIPAQKVTLIGFSFSAGSPQRSRPAGIASSTDWFWSTRLGSSSAAARIATLRIFSIPRPPS